MNEPYLIDKKQEMVPFRDNGTLRQHVHNVSRVRKRPYADAMPLIYNGHRPKANAAHFWALSEQKAVVNVVKEFVRSMDWGGGVGAVLFREKKA